MTSSETVRVGRRTVDVHRPDKVLFPASASGGGSGEAYTKSDLVEYYRAVAPFMLPHLRGRPLMLECHPDGIDGPQFMQKNTPDHYPDWIERAEVPKEGGTVVHPVCGDTATLVHLADQACLTLHRWLSRADRIDRPDRLVFDLDPADGGDFTSVRQAARLLGELFDELKLPSGLMTTGSRGLHVVVPSPGATPSTRYATSPWTSPTPLQTRTLTTSPPRPARRTAATGSTSRQFPQQVPQLGRIAVRLLPHPAQVAAPVVDQDAAALTQLGGSALVVAAVTTTPEGIDALLPGGCAHAFRVPQPGLVQGQRRRDRGRSTDPRAEQVRQDERPVERLRCVLQLDVGLGRIGLPVMAEQFPHDFLVSLVVGHGCSCSSA